MSKRRRFSNAPKRPIDKQLISVSQSIGTTQTDTKILDITFPTTVVGLRWYLTFNATLTSGPGTLSWAIVVVRDEETANLMDRNDAATFYSPEQNCLTFGLVRLADADAGAGPLTTVFADSTKTMRKLAVGDELHVIADGSAASMGTFNGVVQFFTKS